MPGPTLFDTLRGEVNDVLCAVNLPAWHASTGMPRAGAAARGRAAATLARIARDLAAGDAMRLALDDARAALAGDDPRRAGFDGAERAIAALCRLPARLVEAAAALRGGAQAA